MARSREALFRAVSDQVLAIAAERTVEGGLGRMAEAACDLAGARYAALGVPDGEGGFRHFVTHGMTARQMEAIGPLPRTHGMLGATLGSTRSYRSDDVTADPRFDGYPAKHPVMHAFMGVPIARGGTVLGAFYLADKRPRGSFGEDDQDAVELLAAHAAIAIENARLLERSRALSVVEERNRLARELHDAVSQTMFSAALTAEAAAGLAEPAAPEAAAEMRRAGGLVRDAATELRALIFQLRPAELDEVGLAEALRKHIELVRRADHAPVEFRASSGARRPPDVELAAFRIAQEALRNAVRHGAAERIEVELACADGLRL